VLRRVCELFAGVGGFRLGLSDAGWEVVWSNQWEPRMKRQDASDCYTAHFGTEGHTRKDIATFDARLIPDHELLVGGFPCQDYSVATANAQGIHGKKGVLWWEIRRIVAEKRPRFLLLENVDRLLKSPSKQRGRDFGVMLWCLNDLGYVVEWRTLNAADYGAPQKRRRVFIFAAQAKDPVGKAVAGELAPATWIHRRGFFAGPFPVEVPTQSVLSPEPPNVTLPREAAETSDRFRFEFRSAGLMKDGAVWTYAPTVVAEPVVTLGSILQDGVDGRYFVPVKDIPRWKYLKGAKAEKRVAATGFEYSYAEGPLPFPDPLDRPGRTMLTDEGGLSPSRFKHIVQDPASQKFRVLTPIEAERMNQFPDDWTATGMPEHSRFFCMGNALVVGLVRRMGHRLNELVVDHARSPLPVARASKRVRASRN
jgi:DNA (cytosine-5)-methyltransferase 1